MSRKSPSVVLVGRPNVGKSTLFNRMTGSRRAIVNPMAGTTRDALARPVVWRGTSFQLFDTGGLYGESQDPLHELVVQQGHRAIVGADLLVLLVDGREGLIPGDERIAVWRKFYDWKARRILHFVESTRGGEAAFAVIHCKANIGPRLVTFFAGNRPNDIGAVIGAESYFGSILFALDRFFHVVTRLAADQVFPLSDDAASSASRTGEGAILPDW